MPRHRLVSSLVGAVLLLASTGCSSDTTTKADRTSTTRPATSAPSTTAAPSPDTAAYAGKGPHEVGSRAIALPDGRRVVIWYPAAASAAKLPKDRFDIAGLLSPDLQAQIPADKRPIYEVDAHAGAAPATDGPFPVVLFSHGYAGFPEQSVNLTSHLAQWGFVVVAPDHVERSLDGLLGVAAKGVTASEDPAVLTAALDAAIAEAKVAGSPLEGLLDLDHVAVAGHSAGASAAYATATSEPRVKAFVAYSLGNGRGRDGTGTPPAVPKIPGLVMAGSADGIIPFATTKAVFDGMQAPKYLVEVAGAGHLVFSDLCLIGRDQGGLVGLVKQVGLQLPDNLLRLASDGCEKGDLDPAKAFAAIDHFTVAFLRSTFRIDPKPMGLTAATAKTFTTADITFTADAG